MDPVLLSRIQFGATIGFHFLFAPLSIGLAWLIVALMARYRKTGAEEDGRLARFWVSILAATFAVGVATGIAMEFQFGTNWADYARYVGDIFGAPLAAEALFSFFLESTFIAVLILGWNRLKPTTMWVAALLTAFGATLSAFWILAANSWMQTPAGYRIVERTVNGVVQRRAELDNVFAAILNPSTAERVLHTVDGALMTGAFFMLGISAWFLWKNRHVETARRTFTLALVVALVTSVLQIAFGHMHAIQVARTQPEKLAAFEGLFDTQRRAPLLLFGIPDATTATVRYAVRIPAGLSVFISGHPNLRVQGLKDFPRSEWPPIPGTFYPFHLMVILGMMMAAYPALGVLLLWLRRLWTTRLYFLGAILMLPLPFIANELGWVAAEVGRQPWIVYRVMRTADAISSPATVPPGQIVASLIAFMLVYGFIFFVWAVYLARHIAKGPDAASPQPANEVRA